MTGTERRSGRAAWASASTPEPRRVAFAALSPMVTDDLPVSSWSTVITVIKFVITGSVLALAAAGLSACGEAAPGSTPPAAAEAANPASTRSGVITTSAGVYRFTPRTCAMGVEDGVHDIEVGGPGVGPDGQPIYVEFTSTGNALDIGLGVDGAFATAERRLIAGQHVTQPIAFEVSGNVIRASGVALGTDQGERVDDNASFEIDCG